MKAEIFRFDRYTVSYTDVFRQTQRMEKETLYQAVQELQALLNDITRGFPRNPDPEKAGFRMTHEVYYGVERLKQHIPYTANVIYTALMPEKLNELLKTAEFTPKQGELYVCGEMLSELKAFAVVESVNETQIVLMNYQNGKKGKLEMELTKFKSLYHSADAYAKMEFEKKQKEWSCKK